MNRQYRWRDPDDGDDADVFLVLASNATEAANDAARLLYQGSGEPRRTIQVEVWDRERWRAYDVTVDFEPHFYAHES